MCSHPVGKNNERTITGSALFEAHSLARQRFLDMLEKPANEALTAKLEATSRIKPGTMTHSYCITHKQQ
ncbi:hypothetical protein [Azonexus sp.]|uniref:hypothetical protein n=1 Tax=Azonexus sp. TaxID=1872668 RepID=UPI0027B9C573|nr:hypothetical protein [Azonexus sp.]